MKTANSLKYIVWLAWMAVGTLSAQTLYPVKGKVQGSHQESLVGANVVLKANRQLSAGASTEADGSYSLQVPKGNYQLEISYIGYTPYTAQVEVDGPVNIPLITLQEDSEVLDAVVVTAQTTTYHANGYVAEISKNPFFREQDMETILKMTPGTYSTYNSIEVYGKQVSKVYMNGREIRMQGEELMNYLKTIVGKNVRKMEVIAATGVEEDASAAGSSIIKITTFNPEVGGMLNVMYNTAFDQHGKDVHVPSVNLNWRLGKKWATYFQGGASYTKIYKGSNNETHFYDTDVRLVDETDVISRNKGFYRALWGLSYDLDENHLFSFEAFWRTSNRESESHNTTRRLVDGKEEFQSEGTLCSTPKNDELNLSFLYTYKINDRSELNFKADYLQQGAKEGYETEYRYATGTHTASQNVNEEDSRAFTAGLDYALTSPEAKGKLKAGVKYSNISIDQHTDYAYYQDGVKDLETSYLDNYRYSEEVYAAYAKYSYQSGNWEWSGGARVEHAQMSPRSAVNPERNVTNRSTDWSPELGIHYYINKKKGHHLSLNYNRSVHRPSFGSLNPMLKRVNEYTYETGNPLLKPGINDVYSFRTTWFNGYTLRLTHSYTKDGLITVPQNIDGILYSSPQRGMKSSDYSVHVGFPVRLGQWGQLNGSVRYTYLEQTHQGHHASHDRWGFYLSGMFRLPADISMDFAFDHSTPMRSLYGKTTCNPFFIIGLSRSFLKRSLNVSVRLQDVFDSFGSIQSESAYPDHRQIRRETKSMTSVIVNLRYTFRWGQKQQVRRGGSGNSSESSRLSKATS